MKLLEQLARVAWRRRMAEATIAAYSSWVGNYLAHCAARHGQWMPPEQLHTVDVEAYLNHLVLEKRLSASSQNQALNALVFLYRHVLENAIPQDHLGKFVLLRSRRKKRVPTVLSVCEVTLLLPAIEKPKYRLMVKLLYGTGLRIAECCTLRVRDIDLARGQIIVREDKGDKDRVVMLPQSLTDTLTDHLADVERTWRADVARGAGYAPVPDARWNTSARRAARSGRFSSCFRPRCSGGIARGWGGGGMPMDRRWTGK
jgi:site-specific recombinase XerD